MPKRERPSLTTLRISAAFVITFAVAGCNPNGTCIRQEAVEDMCAINMTKGTCGEGGEWVKENEVQGLLHCKMAGYEEHRSSPPKKPGEMTYFYKRHR